MKRRAGSEEPFDRAVNGHSGKRRRMKFPQSLPGKRSEDATDYLEKTYEKSPRRSMNHERKVKMLLPVKTGHGVVRKSQVVDDQQDEAEAVLQTDDSEEDCDNYPVALSTPLADAVPQDRQPPRTVAQQLSYQYGKLRELKQRMGTLASDIVEDPQERVTHLKELLAFLRADGSIGLGLGTEHLLRRLAALTLLEVFKDVVPGYAITGPTTTGNVRLKKDTRALQGFEEALLRYYGQYVTCLRKMLARYDRRDKKSPEGVRQRLAAQLAHVAGRCVCGLLLAHPHFNLREQLVSLAVHCLGSEDEELSRTACHSLKQLYRQDRLGQATLEAVRKTRALLRARGLQVHPRVLEPFLELKLKEEPASQGAPNLKKVRERLRKLSRREHKHHKRLQKLEAQLRETEAQESEVQRDRLQGQILQQLLWTYAHVLKQVLQRPVIKPLLGPVLRGVSRFAHLVNLDFLEDLLGALSALLDQLGPREVPLCLQAAFALLSGQGKALNVDPQRFYLALFGCMLSNVDARAVLLCWRPMVTDRCRSLSAGRIRALLKRLATLCLAQTGGALALSLALGALLRSEPRLQVLLDSTEDQGTFRPELPDPDHAGSAPLWELHLLRRHCQPSLASWAGALAAGSRLPPALVRLEPHKALSSPHDLLSVFPGPPKGPHMPEAKAAEPQQ
ncbi:unnamed protein product [Ixodes pacificus]